MFVDIVVELKKLEIIENLINLSQTEAISFTNASVSEAVQKFHCQKFIGI